MIGDIATCKDGATKEITPLVCHLCQRLTAKIQLTICCEVAKFTYAFLDVITAALCSHIFVYCVLAFQTRFLTRHLFAATAVLARIFPNAWYSYANVPPISIHLHFLTRRKSVLRPGGLLRPLACRAGWGGEQKFCRRPRAGKCW